MVTQGPRRVTFITFSNLEGILWVEFTSFSSFYILLSRPYAPETLSPPPQILPKTLSPHIYFSPFPSLLLPPRPHLSPTLPLHPIPLPHLHHPRRHPPLRLQTPHLPRPHPPQRLPCPRSPLPRLHRRPHVLEHPNRNPRLRQPRQDPRKRNTMGSAGRDISR